MTSCRQIVASLSFFQFMTNFEQSESRIPDAQSVKITFSLTATFSAILPKSKTELKNLQYSSHNISLSKSTIIAKKSIFSQKNVDTTKIKRVLVLKDIFSEPKHVCVLMHQISSFQRNPNKFQTGGSNPPFRHLKADL